MSYNPTATVAGNFALYDAADDARDTLAAADRTRIAALEAAIGSPQQVYFAAGTVLVTEGNSGTKDVTTTLKRSRTSGALDVLVPYVGGTMSALDFAGDVLPGTKTAHFADGSDTATVVDTIKSDTAYEADETFGRSILSGNGYTVGSPNAVTITVTNDDAQASVQPTATGPGTASTAAGQGYEVKQLRGFTAAPTISPNDGRYVVGAKVTDTVNGDYYPVAVGTTARTAGTVSYTASGATGAGTTGSVTFPIATTNPVADLRKGDVGMNTTTDGYGYSFGMFLDVMRTAGHWGFQTGGDPNDDDRDKVKALGANGYPTAANAGNNSVATLIGISKNGRYFVKSNGTCPVTLASNNSGTCTLVDGSNPRRMVYDVVVGNSTEFKLTFGGTDGYPDAMRIALLTDEAKLNAGQVFSDGFIADCSKWSTLRFLDINNINNTHAADPSFRASSPDVLLIGKVLSLKDQVDLCNLADADMWYQVPMEYTEASLRVDLTYIRDNLSATRKMRLEYLNEGWNFGFATFQYIYYFAQHDAQFLSDYRKVMGDNTALGNEISGTAYKAAQHSITAQDVFKDQPTRLRVEAGLQTYYPRLDQVQNGARAAGYELKEVFTNFACTFYLDGGLTSTSITNRQTMRALYDQYVAGNASQKQAIIARLASQVRNGGDSGFPENGATFANWKSQMLGIKSVADANNMGISFYEGQIGHWNYEGMPEDAPPELSESTGSTKAQVDARNVERNNALAADVAKLDVLVAAMTAAADFATLVRDQLDWARTNLGAVANCVYMQYGIAFGRYGPWGSKLYVGAPETTRSQAYLDQQFNTTATPPAIAAFAISGNPPANAPNGIAYSYAPTITGGRGPFYAKQKSGNLPHGIALKGAREFGTPDINDTYSFAYTIFDRRTGVGVDVARSLTVAAPVKKRSFWVELFPRSDGSTDQYQWFEFVLIENGTRISNTGATFGSGTNPTRNNSGDPNQQAAALFDGVASAQSAAYPPGNTPNPMAGIIYPDVHRPEAFNLIISGELHVRFKLRMGDPSELNTTGGTVIYDGTQSDYNASGGGTVTAITYP